MASRSTSTKKRCLSPETNPARTSSSKRKKTHKEMKSNRKHENKHSSSSKSSTKDHESRKNRKTDTTPSQPSSPKKKLKSISQLARLVQLGKIAIPKSLLHYMDDSPQLLDQVFTILTPEDVKGMLPDILKGLKIKQIKQLCLAQLRLMSVDELRKVILNEREPEPLEHIHDKTILELTGRSVKGESAKEDEKFAGEDDKYESEGTDSGLSSSSGSNMGIEMHCASMPLFSTQICKPNSADTKSSPGSDNPVEVQNCSHPSSPDRRRSRVCSKHTTQPGKEPESDGGMYVSDVSDGVGETRTTAEWQMRDNVATDGDEVCRVGAYDEDCIDIGIVGPSENRIDRELVVHRQLSSQAEPKEKRRREEKNSESEDEYSLESSWEQEVPEAARIMEMELRKRALEAALRHSTAIAGRQSKNGQQREVEPKAKQTTISKQTTTVRTHKMAGGDLSESGSDVDPSQCNNSANELEMQLRQRALQSMLARKASQAKIQCV